jgi:hypothetical protein
MAFAPSRLLFRPFIDEAQGQLGSVHGRQMYDVMRCWDDDHPEWDAEQHAFAAAWRNVWRDPLPGDTDRVVCQQDDTVEVHLSVGRPRRRLPAP